MRENNSKPILFKEISKLELLVSKTKAKSFFNSSRFLFLFVLILSLLLKIKDESINL